MPFIRYRAQYCVIQHKKDSDLPYKMDSNGGGEEEEEKTEQLNRTVKRNYMLKQSIYSLNFQGWPCGLNEQVGDNNFKQPIYYIAVTEKQNCIDQSKCPERQIFLSLFLWSLLY